ncbi:MAG: hypothetical protein LDL13_01760 [Calditerrivibrio sp.]|nr:hypothetical protein [Calditerrivibrio sp.]MCA1932286.1 hypothetical protein [Calditerrivibrio sp.]
MVYIIIFFGIIFVTLPQLKSQINTIGISYLIIFILSLYFYLKKNNDTKTTLNILNGYEILSIISGAMLTFFLSRHIGAITASGIVGFIGYLISMSNKKLFFIQFSVFCGSFVGMTGSFYMKNYYELVISSFISGIIYIFLKNHFLGFGGKLGAIAFSAVLITIFLTGLLRYVIFF